VEFGDYDCPACRRQASDVARLLARYTGLLRYTWRHRPLRSLHPAAYAKAIAAEGCHNTRGFWAMHDALLAGSTHAANMLPSPKLGGGPPVDELTSAKRATTSSAKSTVDADIQLAEALGVNKVPTFFLCLPDGSVVRLGALERVERYLPPPRP